MQGITVLCIDSVAHLRDISEFFPVVGGIAVRCDTSVARHLTGILQSRLQPREYVPWLSVTI